jgi:peptide/nickel transport system ATP-binding protein
MTEPVLSVTDLSVTYRRGEGSVRAVRDVGFEVGRGEVLGLLGESGSGKSTIAMAIMRLLTSSAVVEGSIRLEGTELTTLSPGRIRAVRWARASMVFQGALHALNPVQRIGDQVAEALLIHRLADRAQAQARTAELLERVGLPARRARDYPHELSGGQKQRMMIAMALACEPALVIADEPTTALDVVVQAQVLRLLKSLQADTGLAMVFITHDLSVLAEVADRLAVLHVGEIVEQGPARALFETPAHPYTRALAESFPEIGDPRHRRAPVGLAGDPPDPASLPAGCPFHPRCPSAMAVCAEQVPAWTPLGADRGAACLRHQPDVMVTAEAARC